MKIVVTGGAGFIGSHIVDGYLAAGHEVVVIDDLTVGKKEQLNSQATFYRADVTDLPALIEIFDKEQPDVINHHAAQKFLRRSVEFPVEDAVINIIGSINLLDLAQKYGVQKFIFASTAAVYGDQSEQLPYSENTVGQPIAPYGVAKFSVEHYMHTYQHNAGLQTVALRYSNVYGPRQDAHGESGVIAIFAEQLLAGQTPKINGSGQQTRDYIYIDDVVQANLAALESNFSGVANISTNTEVSLLEVYQMLSRELETQIEPEHGPAKKGDPERLVLDNAKAKEVLNWQPAVSLEEGIQRTVDWFKAQ